MEMDNTADECDYPLNNNGINITHAKCCLMLTRSAYGQGKDSTT